MTFDAFQRELGKGLFRGAYLFAGKEDILADRGVRELTEKLLKPEERDLNLNVHYGRDSEAMIASLMSPPVFASRRVVIVKAAQEMSPKALEETARYLKSPPADGCLALIVGELDKRRLFYKRLFDQNPPLQIELVECVRPRDQELPGWIAKHLAGHSKKMTPEALERFSSLSWPGLRELTGELDRISLMVGDKHEISLADIEEAGGGSFALDGWKLGEAIIAGETAKSLEILDNILSWSAKANQIVAMLHHLFKRLWLMRYYKDKRLLAEAQKSPTFKSSYAFKKTLEAVENLSLRSIEDCLLRLQETELGIKSSRMPGEVEANLLTVDLIRILQHKPGGAR